MAQESPQGPSKELPEGAEAAPQEFQDAVQAADRARLEAILDKAASDPAWKQQLLDDPEAAMAAMGASEGPPELGEVAGQRHWRTKWVKRYFWENGYLYYYWAHWRW
jgi:hypothetical protein